MAYTTADLLVERLIDWGVDGITTDYPDRLMSWLAERAIAVA